MKQKVISYIIIVLKRLTFLIERKFLFIDSNEQALNSLAPKIIIDEVELKKITPYLDNLRKSINTQGINNIALTGSYGSGKSTILKTFQYHNRQYDYLNISLASFKDNKTDKENEFERKLEVSILQQIFYHVKPTKIPDSRFKRIINITTSKLILQTLFVISWAVSSIILFKFDYIHKLNPISWKSNLQIDWFSILLILLFFAGIGFFVKSVVRLFSNSKISKFNIKGEIELGEANEKSVFNQHLEEILYFFERTSFNVVIIEDVDRFNSTDIFTKLREINILLNNSNLIKRKVSFIYAIKDEMFKDSNERVKFFEFIIPVIPFVNPSNAGEQLQKLITTSNLQDDLSAEFINDVTTFINDIDMRLLINIFQEFQLFKENLKSVVKYNELFAIIVYKNMFPEDFGNLPKRSGMLYNFFSRKAIFIKSMISEIEYEIKSLEKENLNIENERITSRNKLKHIYIGELLSSLSSPYTINGFSVNALYEEANFNSIVNNENNFSYQTFTPYYGSQYNIKNLDSGIKFRDIEKRINPQITYLQRIKLIEAGIEGKQEENKKKIESLRRQIQGVELMSIQEIFQKLNIDDYLEEFKENSLMRSLLLNGYINENYNDYISVFHEITLTQNDFDFERKVKSGVTLPYTYELIKTENIIKKLSLKYFTREVILNFDLLDELLNTRFKYADKYNSIFELLNGDSKKIYEFIFQYIDKGKANISIFLKELVKTNKNFISHLLTISSLPDDKIRNLISLIFNYATVNDITNQSNITLLTNWFNDIQDFCSYSSKFTEIKKLQSFLKEQNAIISQLDSPTDQTNDIFSFIVANNLYLITPNNLLIIANWHNSTSLEIEFNTSNYTLIKNKMPKTVITHIDENISTYVKNVLLSLPENKNETEESMIELLNKEKLSAQLKADFIHMQGHKIASFSSIDKVEDMDIILTYNKIQPTWENIFYYNDCLEEDNAEINQIMIDYFNEEFNHKNLAIEKLSIVKEKDEEYIKSFSLKLIYCNELNFTAYTHLLKSIPYRYSSLQFDRLNKQKIEWMIDFRFITLNQLSFEEIKKIDKKLAIKLVEVYEGEFVLKPNDFSFDAEDWLQVFKSTTFRLENKLKLISEIDDNIIIENQEIADIVCHLLPNNKYIPLKYEVLEALFKANNSVQKRIELLNLHFDSLDDGSLQSLVIILGEDYAKMFIKQKKPTISNTSFNTNLVDNLKRRELISSYSINNERNEIRVIAKYVEG
jgi:hypothetical protein